MGEKFLPALGRPKGSPVFFHPLVIAILAQVLFDVVQLLGYKSSPTGPVIDEVSPGDLHGLAGIEIPPTDQPLGREGSFFGHGDNAMPLAFLFFENQE